MEVKEALHKLKRKGLPYKYDLNVYRGCSHRCRYYYVQKSHKYLKSNNFGKEIFVKTNIVETLEKLVFWTFKSKAIYMFTGMLYMIGEV